MRIATSQWADLPTTGMESLSPLKRNQQGGLRPPPFTLLLASPYSTLLLYLLSDPRIILIHSFSPSAVTAADSHVEFVYIRGLLCSATNFGFVLIMGQINISMTKSNTLLNHLLLYCV